MHYSTHDLRKTMASLLLLTRFVRRDLTDSQIEMDSYWGRKTDALASDGYPERFEPVEYGEFKEKALCDSVGCMLGWSTLCLPVPEGARNNMDSGVRYEDIDLEIFTQHNFPALIVPLQDDAWNLNGQLCFASGQTANKADCIMRMERVISNFRDVLGDRK